MQDMLGNWRIKANAPGDSLSVYISVQHPELGNYFVATLKAKRLSSSLLPDHAMFFWLMPHKVAVWIYWHAFKLWWQNVQFIQHPRYADPAYKNEALLRDQKLQCCKAGAWDKDRPTQTEGHHLGNSAERNHGIHCFKWRDARWPWS
uniref:Uncharacterized protein n=2 Tax=Rhizophora mucronata TaxID=61149 RepID=A0A2P2K1G3_RHIMU